MSGVRTSPVLRQIQRLYGAGTVAGLGEGHLLERFVATRDEAAFEALVARHGPMVLGVCRRHLRDAHAIEDAFQATFLILVRRAGSIRDRDLLGNWLYGVARRVAVRARAQAGRRKEAGLPDELPAASGEGVAERVEAAAILDEELSRLPETFRAPIVLCALEGLSHEQAAERLRCPVGTVRSRMARGREKLRERLARRGVVPAIAAGGLFLPEAAPAAVAPVLIEMTVRAALAVAVNPGLIAAGTISAGAVALSRGVLNAMLLSKVKVAAVAGLVAVGVIGGGAGLAARQDGDGPAADPAAAFAPPSQAPAPFDEVNDPPRLQLRAQIVAIEADQATLKQKLAELDRQLLSLRKQEAELAQQPRAGATDPSFDHALGRGARALGEPTTAARPVPRITRVDPDTRMVLLDAGSASGLVKGMICKVYRLGEGEPGSGNYGGDMGVGSIELQSVREDSAVGRIVSERNASFPIRAGDLVQPGMVPMAAAGAVMKGSQVGATPLGVPVAQAEVPLRKTPDEWLQRLQYLMKLNGDYVDELKQKRERLRQLTEQFGANSKETLGIRTDFAYENKAKAEQLRTALLGEILQAEADISTLKAKLARDPERVLSPAEANDPVIRELQERINDLNRQLAVAKRHARKADDPAFKKWRDELEKAEQEVRDRRAVLRKLGVERGVDPAQSPANPIEEKLVDAKERLQKLKLYDAKLAEQIKHYEDEAKAHQRNALDLQAEQEQIAVLEQTSKELDREIAALKKELIAATRKATVQGETIDPAQAPGTLPPPAPGAVPGMSRGTGASGQRFPRAESISTIIAPARASGRMSAYSAEKGQWFPIELPEGVTASAVVAEQVSALAFEGESIPFIAVFVPGTGRWFARKLIEPVSGRVDPTLGERIVGYHVGRRFYAFSLNFGRWSVLELGDETEPTWSYRGGLLTLEHGGKLYVFSDWSGTWSAVDAEGRPQPVAAGPKTEDAEVEQPGEGDDGR